MLDDRTARAHAVLAAIVAYPGLTGSQLAYMAGMPDAAVTRALRWLDVNALAVRTDGPDGATHTATHAGHVLMETLEGSTS